MSIIEACGRAGTASILLLLAILLLRDARGLATARYAALFSLGVVATEVVYAPPLLLDRAPWLLPLRLLAYGNPAVFWVVSSALFDDEFTPDWRHLAAWLGLVSMGLWAVYGAASARPFLFVNLLGLLCVLLALQHVFLGRAGDLVEARRRLRLIFVASVGAFTFAVITTITVLRGEQGYPAYGLADAYGGLALSLLFAVMLLSLNPGGMLGPLSVAQTVSDPGEAKTVPDDPREAALLTALVRMLEDDKVYRDERLNIAALAARLNAPEYRLRRVINRRLGHRNFAAFLNGYRLDEAMAALADAGQAEVPILTIGLDAGFNSIGSFNRTFKARTGLTPSEFRRRKLANEA